MKTDIRQIYCLMNVTRQQDLLKISMLAANETIAEDYFWQGLPFLYRSHEKPDPEKINRLVIFINNFGYSLHINGDEVHPKEFQKLLKKNRRNR